MKNQVCLPSLSLLPPPRETEVSGTIQKTVSLQRVSAHEWSHKRCRKQVRLTQRQPLEEPRKRQRLAQAEDCKPLNKWPTKLGQRGSTKLGQTGSTTQIRAL